METSTALGAAEQNMDSLSLTTRGPEVWLQPAEMLPLALSEYIIFFFYKLVSGVEKLQEFIRQVGLFDSLKNMRVSGRACISFW